MWILLGILTICVIYMAFRLARLRSVLDRLANAVERGKPFLFDIEGAWGRRYHIEKLGRLFNNLSADREKSSRQERSSLRQLDVTLGNLTEAVFVVDNSGRLYLANTAACKLFGVTGALEGQKIESVIQSAKFLEFMRKIRYGKTPGRGEIEMMSGPQTLFMEVAGARIPESDDDSRDLTLFVLHDVTNLKRLENVRKEFVANVSHELRTPVTIIKGYSDALLEDYYQLADGERLRFLKKIHKNVERLHLLLEDLLILSRLEWETENLNRELCSLDKIISDLVESAQPRLKDGTETIGVHIGEGASQLSIDSVKVGQVLQNLLDNAIRYAKGFTKITISTERKDDRILIAVEDDGCGIPASDIEHIFERFYRVDKGRSREFGGTGLGLSIVKHIVQLHGGEVRALSKIGEGTRIEVDFPIVESDDADDAQMELDVETPAKD